MGPALRIFTDATPQPGRTGQARRSNTHLVRPDGYLAWASDEQDFQSRARAARAAVRWWCGSG